MKLGKEAKEVKEFSDNNYIGYGVHKVQIVNVTQGETDSGKEYVEFEVIDENGAEDAARVWFTTEKAANYSFNVCRQIYVHNAPEEAKDAARDTMDACETTEALVEAMQEKLPGGECWFTKYLDPSHTYEAADGSVRQSVNKNVYGYEPKLRPDLMPNEDGGTGHAAVDKTFPGATKDDGAAANGIPPKW